ncbi:MAG: PEP/pyruvate-binding domain-containing protein [Pseudomonadota bacterium]
MNGQPKEPLILPLATTPSLNLLGGKGESLANLVNHGFAVPDGFHVTTVAYQLFAESAGLDRLLSETGPVVTKGQLDVRDMGESIVGTLRSAPLPDDIAECIRQAWRDLGDVPLAVRSSATAEDLPDFSFAGQQDTFLNINGEDALLDAVRQCWASLWNERAISYRHQVGIPHASVMMAVVVQHLKPADVAGVLFTANPSSGDREETVINASLGLGESVVSGVVTPDTYVVNRRDNTREAQIGSKQTTIVANDTHGVRTIDTQPEKRGERSLSDVQIDELMTLADRVVAVSAGQPQDIEWLFADRQLWLLQARPITRLPPPPMRDVTWDAPEPSAFLGRSQLVEHIPDPVSTLFEDLHMKRSLQHFWGLNLVRRGRHDYADTQPPASFVVQTTVNGYAYRQLGEPPRSGRITKPGWRFRRPEPITRIISAWTRRWQTYRMWLWWVPEWRFVTLPRYLSEINRWRLLSPAEARTEQLWMGIRALSFEDARYWYQGGVWNAFSLTRGTESMLSNFLAEHTGGELTSGQFLSGLKSPAFDAHVALWRIAQRIVNNDQLHALTIRTPAALLLTALESLPAASEVCRMLEAYRQQYGHQIFNLDFADPSEGEQPEYTARALHALVLQPDYDPVANQRDLARERSRAMNEAWRLIPKEHHWAFRKKLWQARHYYPNREAAMFHLGRAWTVLRPLAIELGRRLAMVGTLTREDDIFFLKTDELGRAIRALIAGDAIAELAGVAMERRELREARRQLTPPMHIGKVPVWLKDRVSEEETSATGDTLEGSAVSPGQVTGPASLILSSLDFDRMKPDSILVCPATTPAWTQLFPRATGLVTDIGGILAHGSIVAREYGIPAVLGIGDATHRIRDGQMITVDGYRGTVILHDDLEDTS